MPRKMRPTKVRRTQAPDVSAALYTLLLYGDWSAAVAQQKADESDAFELWDLQHHHEVAWHAIVDRAIAEWVRLYPGTRPASWWYWSAPELRAAVSGTYKHLGGRERCHETGLPFISNGFDSPPVVESEAAFLDRLALWLPGERARVPTEAFEPQRFSYDLTVGHQGVPGDDEVNDDDDDDN